MKEQVTPLKSSLIRKTLILFGCMFALQILYVGTVFTMVEQTRQQVREQQEARQVLSSIGRVMRSLQDLTICIGKGELVTQSNTNGAYQERLDSLNRDLRMLKSVLAGKAIYVETMGEIEATCKKIPEVYAHFSVVKQRGKGFDFHIEDKVMKMGRMDMEWVRIYMSASEVLARLEAIQSDYRQAEEEAQQHLQFQSSLLFNAALFMGFIATALVAFLLYHIFISGLVGRLRLIGKTLDDIAAGKPLKAQALAGSDDQDEVGYLAAELQSMERSLRTIRSKENVLLENAASCICSIDEHGKFVMVSRASAALWGKESSDLLNTPLTDLIEEDDAELVEQKLDELFQSGKPVTFECRIKQSEEGQGIEFAWTASLVETQNLAICVAHDVTARNEVFRQIKQRETEFRSMIDCMPIAVITCDQMNAISSINPVTQTMLDYSPQDLLGKKLSMLLFGSTNFSTTTNEQINEVLSAAEKHSIELVVSKADGSRLPVEFSSRHYELQESPVHLATFKDVSARFEIETVKKEFVAMISHDLRSPLTAVHGTLEVIGFDNAKSAATMSAEDVANSKEVAHAQQIVFSIVNVLNDFLDLEKFEAGLVALELQEVSLSELISDVQEKLKARSEPLIAIDTGELSATKIKLDIERLSFALTTIILVADHFKIYVQSALKLSVSRSAAGINLALSGGKIPEHIESAFHSPYTFLSDTTLDGIVTSGLGISLSRAIIYAHGGSVSVERENNKVSITLPI